MSLRNLVTPSVGPPVLWRTSRWCLVLACLCVAGAFGTLLLRGTAFPKRQPWPRYAIMAFGFAPVLVIYPVGYLVQRRALREWHRTNGRLCARCGYDLTALADTGICPECGNPYDLEQDAALWADVGLTRDPNADTPAS